MGVYKMKHVLILLLGFIFLGAAAPEPQHIQVQHILIGFKGTLPGKNITRSKAEAEKLAEKLMAEAKKSPNNFGKLVEKNTDDAAPGIYGMSNVGVPPSQGEYPRQGMVPAFGNVGFKLKVGEVGLAKFDVSTSPYGYHIIKRLK